MKESSNSFYPKLIFIEGVVKCGKIPSEIVVIFQPNILRIVGFYVRHSATVSDICSFIGLVFSLFPFRKNPYITISVSAEEVTAPIPNFGRTLLYGSYSLNQNKHCCSANIVFGVYI